MKCLQFFDYNIFFIEIFLYYEMKYTLSNNVYDVLIKEIVIEKKKLKIPI